MSGKGEVGGYLKSRLPVVLLFAVLLAGLTAVYALYHLPWGPALYVSLLMLAVFCVVGLLDFRRYDKKLRCLAVLKKQAENQLGELPGRCDAVETAYLQLAKTLETRCVAAEARMQQSEADAKRYYTLWSHQIKTPIAAMRLLLQEDSPDREALSRECFKVEQYVEMVLQYQRLGSGTHDLDLREYDLESLVKQGIRHVSTLFIYKKIALHLGELSAKIITDEKWLVFVLEQLLTNAVKYTQSGSVSLTLAEDAPCTLVIADTGIGILPQDLPRVFEWGYTGYNGRLEQRSTGIGLALCKQAMALLGHGISITSEVGQGTSVRLDLSHVRLELE